MKLIELIEFKIDKILNKLVVMEKFFINLNHKFLVCFLLKKDSYKGILNSF